MIIIRCSNKLYTSKGMLKYTNYIVFYFEKQTIKDPRSWKSFNLLKSAEWLNSG